MTAIAIQTAIGDIGSKAVTVHSLQFNTLCNLGPIQIGANESGIYLLNQPDVVQTFEASFTLATTDFGIPNPKALAALLVGININAPNSFDIHLKYDDSAERTYSVVAKKLGLQRLRVPIGTLDQGRYITIRISSNSWFSIDSIQGVIIVRNTGITGYN